MPPPNELEALITPDETSIINNPLLSGTPFIVNTRYSTLICLECKKSIDPDQARAHATKNHKECRLPADFDILLNRAHPWLVKEKIHPKCIVAPIFGLAIRLNKFHVCDRCLQGYSTVPSFDNHACAEDVSTKPGSTLHHVQTFFLGPRCSFFPVTIPQENRAPLKLSHYEAFKKQQETVKLPESEMVETEDYRQLHRFLRKEGWIDHLKKLPSQEISSLVASPAEEENVGVLSGDVLSLMTRIQFMITATGFQARRLIGHRPS